MFFINIIKYTNVKSITGIEKLKRLNEFTNSSIFIKRVNEKLKIIRLLLIN